jgi:epoxide hydrolase 4
MRENLQAAWNLSTRRVTVAEGISLHVAEAGQGPPLLMLHGFPDNGDLWRPLLSTLAPAHRVWMPDLRGYRHSDKPPQVRDYALDVLVADVLALIDAMTGSTQDRVALAGHDWGGMLAWAVAALHPQRVSHLVVFNAPHPCRFAQLLQSDPAQREASAYVPRLASPGAEAVLAADGHARLRGLVAGAVTDSPSGGLSAQELDALARGWAMPGALSAMLRWYRALDMHHPHSVPLLAPASGHIQAPTLLLWGEREGSFVPANLHGLGHWVPRLTLHRFANAGHWLPREQPEAAAWAMAGFLRR